MEQRPNTPSHLYAVNPDDPWSPSMLLEIVLRDDYLEEVAEDAMGDPMLHGLLIDEMTHTIRAILNPTQESVQDDWRHARDAVVIRRQAMLRRALQQLGGDLDQPE